MPRAGIPWICTITDTRKGSGSMGTGPGRKLGFVCDTGFGWQKQKRELLRQWGMVGTQVCWGRSRKGGTQRAEKSCDF